MGENAAINIISASIVFLTLAVFIVLFVLAFNKKQQLYLEEKRLLQEQFQQQILQAQLETQEETLNIISQELHDNIGQLLNSSKLLLGIVQRSPRDAVDTLKTAEETLGKAIHEVRTLAKALNKDWLQQFDLIDNLRNEIIRLNGSMQLQLQYIHPESIPMDHDNQIILFRIIQEALQNLVKHAEATQGEIRISCMNNKIQVHLSDNGKGFDTSQSAQKGLGLSNMRNRVKVLGGHIDWESSSHGTIIKLELPVQTQSKNHG